MTYTVGGYLAEHLAQIGLKHHFVVSRCCVALVLGIASGAVMKWLAEAQDVVPAPAAQREPARVQDRLLTALAGPTVAGKQVASG